MATITLTAPMDEDDFDKAVAELWHQMQANRQAFGNAETGESTVEEPVCEAYAFAASSTDWLPVQETEPDMVNHPNHYMSAAVEPLELFYQLFGNNPDIIYGGLMFNVLKYSLRAPYKGKPDEDKEKAVFYLNEFKKWFPEIGTPKIN